jgi:replicative DNA helicase
MNPQKGNRPREKRFDELLPKLDNGTTDWEAVKKRLSQNLDAAEILLGKLPPQALEVEKAILGACLIEVNGFQRAKDVLSGFKNPFYTDAHNEIWCAMEDLSKNNETIDRLTVFKTLENRLKTEVIGGNPYYLVQLTEAVASCEHVESHARIVLQTHLRRKLMHFSILLYQKSSDYSTDLFNIIEEHQLCINKLIEFNATLKGYEMPHVMEMAEQATTKSFLVGSLIKDEDVAILFSGPENGKSVFSIQMADKISRGESMFSGLLRNECEPKKVLYFDFELTLSDYKSRYTDGAGNKYPFLGEGWFLRVGNDDKNPKTFAEIANNMDRILVRNIELHKPNVVFIDNITAMSNGSTADAEVSKKIMDLLLQLKKKYKLTVIVLAHTPKRYDISKPLSLADLAGSSLLAAYADSIIVIGRSKMGNNIKYLLQLKARSGTKIHDEQNVIQVAIEKEGAFLQMKTLDEPIGRESDHLVSKYDLSIDEELIEKIFLLHKEGKSLTQIKAELNLGISRQYIGQLIKAYKLKYSEKIVAEEEFSSFVVAENKEAIESIAPF